MTNRTIIISSIVFVVALVTFASFSGGDSTGTTGTHGQARGFSNVNIAQAAPEFNLESLNGENLTLASYAGKKPVILDFWASWCPNCRRDMPRLNKFYEKYKDQVEVIGINLQEPKSIAQRYVDNAGIDFPIVLDSRGATSADYGVRYTNTHILIDLDGNILDVIQGDISEKDILSLIQ